MVEILTLLVIVGEIRKMARRRGRNPLLFGSMLVVLWLVGEVAGVVVTYVVMAIVAPGKPALPYAYGGGIAGAAVGAAAVFLMLQVLGPMDGVWRKLEAPADRRSRLLGIVVAGVLVGALGAGVGVFLRLDAELSAKISAGMIGFLIAGFFGALFGMLSGYQKT